MKLLKILSFAILIIGMINMPAEGKIISLSLHEMVEEAELIIIGKVLLIEKTSNKHVEYGYEYKVTIGIEETIKGNQIIKDINIYFYPTLSIEPEFSLNERSVYFIKKWEGKYTVVQGYGGKVAIENDDVKPLYIRDEEKTQKLQIFINRIKKLIK